MWSLGKENKKITTFQVGPSIILSPKKSTQKENETNKICKVKTKSEANSNSTSNLSTKLKISCYEKYNPIPEKSIGMKQKISKFNENPQVSSFSSSKPVYERNEIKLGKVSELIANYSSHQKGRGDYCDKLKSLSLSRLEVPRGFQISFQNKDPEFQDDYRQRDLKKIYEEFDRYDSIYNSRNAVQKPMHSDIGHGDIPGVKKIENDLKLVKQI